MCQKRLLLKEGLGVDDVDGEVDVDVEGEVGEVGEVGEEDGDDGEVGCWLRAAKAAVV